MNPSSYPLHWPTAWPRTRWPERHPSLVRNFVRNRDEVVKQLDALGASDLVVSTNLTTRVDGLPYANQREPEDSGVAVYFTLDGRQQCIPCDKWDTVSQNLRAVALTVEALRGIDRWGAKEMVAAAFRGFTALPETIIMGAGTVRPWHEVLEVSPTASQDVIRAAYKRLLLRSHPDHGGTQVQFEEVQRAYEEGSQR